MSRAWTLKVVGLAVVFAAILSCAPAFAQTGGVTGKCIGQGGAPLVGYIVQVDRVGMKWNGHVKTNKKGEYTYIGLAIGQYKITLTSPDGKPLHSEEKQVGLGDPVEVNFDIEQVMKEAQKEREANPEYKKQVEAQKESASLKQLFDQARAQYEQKQYKAAAATFEKALPLAKDRNVPIILSQLAETWSRAASVETNPDTRKEDYTKALDYYNKVLALLPGDPSLHNNLGHLYADMGKSDEAIVEFQKAAELDPTHASSYYYNLGAILVNKGKMDDAAIALKKATDMDATNANAWYWYGMALLGKANYKADGTVVPAPGTIEAFQTYLKLSPTGKYAPQAQASIDSLQGKTSLEYKAPKKK